MRIILVLLLLLSGAASEAIITNPASLSLTDMAACNMHHFSYVCDPTHMITPLERNAIHDQQLLLKARTKIPSINPHDCDLHGVTPLVLLLGQTSDQEALNTLVAAQQWQLNHDPYSAHCRNYLVIACGQRCHTASNSQHIPADAVNYLLNKQLEYHPLGEALKFTLEALHAGITYEGVLQPWTADKYPNPTVDPGACHITEKSTFCDPDAYFTREERKVLVDSVAILGRDLLPAEQRNEATCGVLRTRIMFAVSYRLVDYSKKGLDEFASRTREAWAKSDPCADSALILFVPTATPNRFAFSQLDNIVNQAEAEQELNTLCKAADSSALVAQCVLNFALKYTKSYGALAHNLLDKAFRETLVERALPGTLPAQQQPNVVPYVHVNPFLMDKINRLAHNPKPVATTVRPRRPLGNVNLHLGYGQGGGYNDFDHHSKPVAKRCGGFPLPQHRGPITSPPHLPCIDDLVLKG